MRAPGRKVGSSTEGLPTWQFRRCRLGTRNSPLWLNQLANQLDIRFVLRPTDAAEAMAAASAILAGPTGAGAAGGKLVLLLCSKFGEGLEKIQKFLTCHA